MADMTMRAKCTFIPHRGLGTPIVHEGQMYAKDAPVVKAFPGNFENLAPRKRSSKPKVVEQATAEPGEKRALSE